MIKYGISHYKWKGWKVHWAYKAVGQWILLQAWGCGWKISWLQCIDRSTYCNSCLELGKADCLCKLQIDWQGHNWNQKGLCQEDLQSLINRCIVEYKTNGQQRPATWIYSKYGNEVLVSHLLTYLKLDSEAILHDMTKNCINLEQAMENNCFARASKQQYDYLEFIYRDVVKAYKNASSSGIIDKDELYEASLIVLEQKKIEFNLTDEEVSFVNRCFEHYTTAVEQYRLFDVGFEKDEDKRVQKIIDYHLDEDEIEEAFFMPLKFDQKALIGRDSELYKRRILLKNIIVSWAYISEEEQQEKVTRYNLTTEEIKYVVETRHKIDQTKQKVLKK